MEEAEYEEEGRKREKYTKWWYDWDEYVLKSTNREYTLDNVFIYYVQWYTYIAYVQESISV